MKRSPECETGDPASEVLIENYQNSLKVGFPSEYRDLLWSFGYIRWSGNYIAGVCGARSKFDVLARTKVAREDKYHGNKFPKHGLAIQAYAGGGYFVLFGSQSEREGEVALFVHEEGDDEVQSWTSLSQYIESTLR